MSTKKALAIAWLAIFVTHMVFLEQLGKWAFFTTPILGVAGMAFVGWPATKFLVERSKK